MNMVAKFLNLFYQVLAKGIRWSSTNWAPQNLMFNLSGTAAPGPLC